ncbi:lipid asymmetry maintenance protein MlaB [Siccibacter colletis]|uniref:Lipid asymmetry maintenance protein MlaB n=1 Tax=Siccibacter colletis TaxID=1505757 RepID=A0ABY6JEW6_9ENTR|nr:lipid asymmetry maintenance protein MlaB [Siccibacter colletis]UYU32366.1 lipid asymmetry maintenance protein MlaB [Siccibacter colletis]WNN48963.1 lipid asymmetry maintenance protein MlaB [Siccibacter colletis]
MSQALSWAREETRLILRGELENDTLLPLWDVREQVSAGVTTLDLSGLTRVDTAGLALIIHLYALASEAGTPVTISGMSENLTALSQLYNLPSSLLPASNN